MSWKNRKLFNNLPQGIVSGLEPIPRYKEGGFVNPRNYIGGGTVEYPIGMEAGTLVPEVFESGDQQINEALNTMIATTMPTGDAVSSIAIEEPTGDVAEIIPETTTCLLYTSPSPRDGLLSRMPSSA